MPQLSLVPSEPPPRAPQACLTCRKQKRKCDKALPSCSRCASLQRACDYHESETGPLPTAAAPTAEDFASLQMKLAQIEARLDANSSSMSNQVNMPPEVDPSCGMDAMDIDGGWMRAGALPTSRLFPSSLFLDIDMYHFAKKTPPKPVVDVPMEVLEILANSDVIEQTATNYFTTIHTWFSFISRKRMNLGISLADGGPDLAMLFLSMKLITTHPPPTPPSSSPADASSSSSSSSSSLSLSPEQTHLYVASKRFLALLEAAGTVSILYLQAMILVALYEYGHAIYPAAWMSVGQCVRYAAMLGLPSYGEASSVLGPCTTWTETEERRRVWWAVHILDRAISLGSKRPFAGGPDLPSASDVFLPVDDAAWDAGDMGRALQRSLTTPVDSIVSLSPFARLAQASLLVTKAMAHCRRAVGRYNAHHDRKQQGRRRRRRRGKSRSNGNHPDNTSDYLHNNDDPSSRPSNGDDARRQRHSPDSNKTTTTTTKPYDVQGVTALISEQSALCAAITRDLALYSSSNSTSNSTSASTPAAAAAPLSSSPATGTGTGTYRTTDLSLAYLPARCLIWSTSVMVLDMYACPEHMRPGGNISPRGMSSPKENGNDNHHDEMEEEEDDDDGDYDGYDHGDDCEGREPDSTEEMELAMQTEAINGLKTVGIRVREISAELLSSFNTPSSHSHSHLSPFSPSPFPPSHSNAFPEAAAAAAAAALPLLLLGKVSPLCLDVLYCGVSTFQWLWRESGDPDMKAGLDVTRTCMERLDVRWRLSGRYLEIASSYNPVPMGV